MVVRSYRSSSQNKDHLTHRSVELGQCGDVKAVGEGISEMRIDTGPGYRVYYKQTGGTIILILCGGDKSSQDKDIKKAKQIAAGL